MKFTSGFALTAALCGTLVSTVNAVSGNAQVVNAYNHESVVKLWDGCTGTLIAPGVVLTAQHCVLDPDEKIQTKKIFLPALPGQTEPTTVGIVAGGVLVQGLAAGLGGFRGAGRAFGVWNADERKGKQSHRDD